MRYEYIVYLAHTVIKSYQNYKINASISPTQVQFKLASLIEYPKRSVVETRTDSHVLQFYNEVCDFLHMFSTGVAINLCSCGTLGHYLIFTWHESRIYMLCSPLL